VDICCHQFKKLVTTYIFFSLIEREENASQVPPRAPRKASKSKDFGAFSCFFTTLAYIALPRMCVRETNILIIFLHSTDIRERFHFIDRQIKQL